MALTLGQARSDVRSLIDEPVAQFWTDAELNNWLNQGAQDIQRRLEWKRVVGTIATVAAQQAYTAPADLLRLYRLEFVPFNNTSYTYSLEFRGYNEMDAVWGNLKSLPSAYPQNYTLWLNPADNTVSGAGLQILLYPVPDTTGTLNLYYYPKIAVAGADGTNLDIPPNWDDLVENFAAYRALRKDADPRWQNFQQDYMTQISELEATSRSYTDQGNFVSTGQQNYNPLFLDLED